jgi:phytoene dehydrogenase-like protein
VHEATPAIGGGARTEELTRPGFLHDVCSAIHPFGAASPFFRRLELDLEWVDPPAATAHPFDDGTAVTLERETEETAVQLGPDGESYRRLVEPLVAAWREIEPVLIGPYPPPVRTLVNLARTLKPRGLERALRAALADARALADAHFTSERARGFFAGHAAHSVLPLERRPSAGVGLSLVVLGHVVGWGFPRGGAQRLADALGAELARRGGRIRTNSPVDELPDADVVLADVVPREFLRLSGGRLPERYARALGRYRHAPGAFKLDWALAAPIPWRAEACRRAATVHLGGPLDEISASEWGAWHGRPATRPFVLLVQHSLFDDTRAPPGEHTAWAYCHVPNGSAADMTDAIEAQVERFAPGFRELVLARSAMGPAELERRNRNLVGGDVNGGAMDLGQLVFRPVRRLVPYRTPLRGVYLCSAATPPGGGVHGMCGYAAAQVALKDLKGSTSRR